MHLILLYALSDLFTLSLCPVQFLLSLHDFISNGIQFSFFLEERVLLFKLELELLVGLTEGTDLQLLGVAVFS